MRVDTRGLLQSLRRGWPIGLIAVVAVPAAAAFFTSRQQPVYRTATSVVVAPAPDMAEASDVLRAVEALERRSILATFVELSKSPAVQRRAAARLGWEDGELTPFRVSSSTLPHANVLRIVVEGPDPERAATLAGAVAAVMGEEAHGLYRPFSVRVLTEATPAAAPTMPDRRRNYLVALVLGLFLGGVGAYAFGRLAPMTERVNESRPRPAHAAAD